MPDYKLQEVKTHEGTKYAFDVYKDTGSGAKGFIMGPAAAEAAWAAVHDNGLRASECTVTVKEYGMNFIGKVVHNPTARAVEEEKTWAQRHEEGKDRGDDGMSRGGRYPDGREHRAAARHYYDDTDD